MYSHQEFDEWIREFAKVNVTLPKNSSEVMYDIPAPSDGLVLRVDPKIGVDGEWKGGSPEVYFVSRKGSVTHIDTITETESWSKQLESAIRSAMREWRDHMIQ